MQQQQRTRSAQSFQQAEPQIRPKRADIFLHGFKTARLLGRLMTDRRISVLRKLGFIAAIAALIVVLFFPDLLSESFLTVVLPIIGTILGVPIDIGADWVAFALIVVSLLRIFPPEIVSEHYRDLFHEDYRR